MTNADTAAPPPPRRPVGDLLRRYGSAAAIIAVHFAVFGLARFAVLLAHRGDFSGLGGSQVLSAFLRGIRFDASAIAAVIGLPMFLFLVPVPATISNLWRRAWGWVLFALFTSFLFVLAIDLVYYGEVHRHAGIEVTESSEVLKAILRSGAVHYGIPALAFLAAVAGAFLGWRRLLRAMPESVRPWGPQAVAAVIVAVLLYFAERGTLSGKRLRVVHAFQDLPVAAGNLALNGPFCVLHTLAHSRSVRAAFYPWPEAVRTAQSTILAPGEKGTDPDYPLLRSRGARPTERPNVVVVLLESWDASATDVHRRELGLAPLGCTPHYDAAAAEGVVFSRFYACGQRSMDGLGATLCGFPGLPGTPYLGRGLEQSSLTGLGRLARKEGYDAWLITAPERDSFRMDAIAGLTGFDHFVAAEDIPEAAPLAPRGVLKGPCWDHEMYAEAARRLSAARAPFLAFLYTAATHHPFSWPGERWARRPGSTLENRYLNSLEYADWALGEFFLSAKKGGWYDRTIFIVTADHIGGPGYGVRSDDPSTLHHIPCLVIAPGLKPRLDRRIGSQLDVIPTIGDLAGWTAPQATFGSSLFGDLRPDRGALCVQGNLVLRIED
ncbi:MAG: LTA synthase family protein, partial [Planctomycetaceae bacterium]|nr:LTA synthase family protein [Planctomycetaceae bacterium]